MPMKRGRLFALLGTTCIVVAIALGVGLGVGLTRKDSNNDRADLQNVQNNAADSSTATPATSAAATASADVSNTGVRAPGDVPALPLWNWRTQKAIGMSLGNMLVLERWMHEDWFVETAGPDAWDEWTFSETLGTGAAAALTEHWNSFISRENITTLKNAGFNHLRVPIGFWALIPLTEGEPYVSTGQLDQLEKLAGWAYEEDMYLMLDLHGLPGSQNGLQQSGHNTSNIQFWSQQDRADATVQAAIAHIHNSTYRSIYSSLAICNEPVTYTDGQRATLREFYDRSYAYNAALDDPIPLVIHDAYLGLDYWRSYLNGKNSSLVMMEDHPYPGNVALDSGAAASQDSILQQVCDKARGYANFEVPVAVTEWSLTSQHHEEDFQRTFYRYQLSAFSASAGSFFWSWNVHASTNPVVALDAASQRTYSYVDLFTNGITTNAPSANTSTEAFLDSLDNPCGLST